MLWWGRTTSSSSRRIGGSGGRRRRCSYKKGTSTRGRWWLRRPAETGRATEAKPDSDRNHGLSHSLEEMPTI